MDHLQALPARYGQRVLGGNGLHLGMMGRLAITRIAGDHAVLVQEVQVLFLAMPSHMCHMGVHPGRDHASYADWRAGRSGGNGNNNGDNFRTPSPTFALRRNL